MRVRGYVGAPSALDRPEDVGLVVYRVYDIIPGAYQHGEICFFEGWSSLGPFADDRFTRDGYSNSTLLCSSPTFVRLLPAHMPTTKATQRCPGRAWSVAGVHFSRNLGELYTKRVLSRTNVAARPSALCCVPSGGFCFWLHGTLGPPPPPRALL